MKLKPSASRFFARIIGSGFLLLLSSAGAYGQLSKIDNKLPKAVPLKVEFKNFGNENWWHDLEIKVTNTGKKPIYYLDLGLWLDSDYTNASANGKRMSIGFRFGDITRFFSATNGELATASDPAILPNGSYTFRVPENFIKSWDLLKKQGEFVEPRTGELSHGWTSFGDGTGLLPGGTPFSQKKN